MAVNYVTREEFRQALDFKESAFSNPQIDRALESGSRSVDKLCHRVFYPTTATKYFDWPFGSVPWRVYLDDQDLISISAVSSGGTSVATNTVFLEPNVSGPPYTRLELDRSSVSAFGGGDTPQRDITITGLWGYSDDNVLAGTIAEALDDTETDVDLSPSASVLVGVGSLLKVDSERMSVTSRSFVTTAVTSTSSLTAVNNSQTLGVASGLAFSVGETLLLDAEKMLITEIAGNNLIVKRAVEGTTLAAHSSSTTIYASRTVTVVRGSQGSAAVTHLTSTPVYIHRAPASVRALALAEAISTVQQEQAAYGRVIGSGEYQREARGAGLGDLRKEVYDKYGRKARIRSI